MYVCESVYAHIFNFTHANMFWRQKKNKWAQEKSKLKRNKRMSEQRQQLEENVKQNWNRDRCPDVYTHFIVYIESGTNWKSNPFIQPENIYFNGTPMKKKQNQSKTHILLLSVPLPVYFFLAMFDICSREMVKTRSILE